MKRHLRLVGIQNEAEMTSIELTATGLGEGRVNASTMDDVQAWPSGLRARSWRM
jgi:hypothetical protein